MYVNCTQVFKRLSPRTWSSMHVPNPVSEPGPTNHCDGFSLQPCNPQNEAETPDSLTKL